jgi:hypothetical protein
MSERCVFLAPSGYLPALCPPSGSYAWYVPVLLETQLIAHAPQKATGGSAMKAVEVIMEHGVPEDRIIFINLVSTAFDLCAHSFLRGEDTDLCARGFEKVHHALSVA